MWSSLHVLNGFLGISNGGNPIPLSEKWLIDCWETNGANYDCKGVWPYSVYEWLNSHTPVVKHAYARYTLPPGECATPTSGSFVTSYIRDTSDVTDDQLVQLLQNGPVVTVFNVESPFYSYSQGILERADSCPSDGSHAVAIVGYGSEDGVDYFTVKNSWGYSWGDKGYFRVRRLGGTTSYTQRYCDWGWVATQPTLSGTMPVGYSASHQYSTTQQLPEFVGDPHKICCVTVYKHRYYGGASKQFCGEIDWVGHDWNDSISSVKVDEGCTAWVYEHAYYDGRIWVIAEDSHWFGRKINNKVSAIWVFPK